MAFDGERLRAALLADWTRLGPVEFVRGRVAPLIQAVGDAWALGRLDVRHEHFLSELLLGDLLRLLRQPFEERDRAARRVGSLAG